jgi:hypothetical protein
MFGLRSNGHRATAATGVRAPAGKKVDGVNLMPVLKQEKEPFARTVFWRYKGGARR